MPRRPRCLLILSILLTLLILQVFYLNHRSSVFTLSSCASVRVYRGELEHEANQTLDIPHCQVLDVAMKCVAPGDVYPCSVQIKSVLLFTRSVLRLHILASTATRVTLRRLLDSWELQHVDIQYYVVQQKTLAVDHFTDSPPPGVASLLILRPNTYFSIDVTQIWDLAQREENKEYLVFSIDSTYNTLHNIPNLPLKQQPRKRSTDAFLIRTSRLKDRNLCQQVSEQALIEVRPDYLFVYQRKCSKNATEKQTVPLDIKTLPRLSLPGLLDPSQVAADFWPEWFTQMRDLSGDWVREREVAPRCRHLYVKQVPQPPPNDDKYSTNCLPYQYNSCTTRRVHLHFNSLGPDTDSPIRSPHSHNARPIRRGDSYDVTLVTQLQYNRIEMLERLISRWAGPMQVVLYVTDREARQLRERLEGEEVGQDDVSYHVVYKRQEYNPINALRNVGLSQTSTPYVFVVDVDFVPMSGLYSKLRDLARYLQTYNKTKKAVVVPTFETVDPSYQVPDSKRELIRHLHTGRVEPYHQGKTWSFKAGHKPHDYQRWFSAKSPYQVAWQEQFEPYFMLPTADSPQFEEVLVERMMDKFPYTLETHLKGYKFIVLHDSFMVHLPHPKSASFSWVKEPYFSWCAKMFYTSIKKRLISVYKSK